VAGRVRLGVCPGLLVDLHQLLAKLRQAHPGLAVEVRQLPEEVRRAVAESAVDLGLTLTRTGEPTGEDPAGEAPRTGVVTTPLLREDLVLATAPGGSCSVPADLGGLSLVDFPRGWAIREAVDRAFPGRRVCLEVDDLAVAAGLVRGGLAACVLPASVAARFADLAVRRFGRPPSWQLAAVHRVPLPAAVGAVLAQLG
jgi:hypothetical protein